MSKRTPHVTFLGSCKYHVLTKKSRTALITCTIGTQRHGDSNPQPLYHRTAGGTTVVPVC